MALTRQRVGDFVNIGGFRSPGLCRVEGAGLPSRWEPRNGYGWSGQWAIYLGSLISEFSIVFTLYGEQIPPSEDWQAWQVFFDAVLKRPPPKQRAKSFDIWHPHLEPLGIKKVGIKNVTQPVPVQNGGWAITVELIQHERPRFDMAKPEGSQSKPTDPYDQEIERLTGQLEELAK